HVQNARHGGGWGELGMPSSRGVKNAPMSVWAFIILASVTRADTPEGLTRAVAALAVVAQIALVFLVMTSFGSDRDREDRRAWLWAAILSSTNPILVFLERKIWAQSVLPIFDVALLAAFFRRDTRLGAFSWGALGAIVGQIHMAGFFFAPSLALYT